jgi:hypothetical protein
MKPRNLRPQSRVVWFIHFIICLCSLQIFELNKLHMFFTIYLLIVTCCNFTWYVFIKNE